MNTTLSVFLAALVGGIVLTPIARWLARRYDIVDRPDGQRKTHRGAVPLCGGVAVFFAVVIALVVAVVATWPDSALVDLFVVMIPVAGFVCFFGCVDDRFNLSPRAKLLLQIIASLPIVLAGYYIQRVALFGYTVELGWLGIPLTVFWLVGCINAVNLLDGMDGLASVVGISSAAMIAIIAAATGREHVALHAVALAGALTAFLIYNLPPASIFLGDSGSMVIGLVLGMLALQSSLKSSATLAITIPAVIMTIPMLDSFMAVLRRRLSGGRIDVGDRGHIHHRLLERGFGNWKALCVIGALCLATGAAAAAATVIRSEVLAWIVAISVVVLLVRLRIFGHHEVALVKLSAASRLTTIAHQMTDSARLVTESGSVHAAQTVDEAWAALVQEVKTCEVDRLDWIVGSVDGVILDERRWGDASSSEFPPRWSCVLRFAESSDRYCEFVVTASSGAAEPSLIYRLTALLKPFGQKWTARATRPAAPVVSIRPQQVEPAYRRAA